MTEKVTFTPGYLSKKASKLSGELGLMSRLIMKYRPFICPFHLLIGYVDKGDRVLDIGCGSGLWLNLLYHTGLIEAGVGIDVDEDSVHSAKKVSQGNDNLIFTAQGADESWPDDNFDVVSAIDVIHHVPREEQRDFVRRLANIKSKRIIFKDIEPGRKFRAFMNTVHDVVLSRQVPVYRSSNEVREWFIEEGYRIEDEGLVNMLWYPHYYMILGKD